MTWNLRVVNMSDDHEDYFEVREVYYDQIGKPIGHTAAAIGGMNTDEMRQYIKWAQEALDKPVLTFKDNHENHS
jgi:hypothetical protein